MYSRNKTQKGQATVEYLLIFAGAVVAVSAGLAAFSLGFGLIGGDRSVRRF